MIKDPERLEEFEMELVRSSPPDYARNIKILEAMLAEAIAVGAFPPKDPLEGIEADIRIARVVNHV